MLNTQQEIIDLCKKENKRIYHIVIDEESKVSKTDEVAIRSHLKDVLKIMEKSATAKLNEGTKSKFNMINDFAKISYDYAENGEPMMGEFLMKTVAMAFSTSEVNCSMGKIVASPTAGSSGILPAAMMAAKMKYNFDQETLENGLLTSIAIGQIIAKYATFAGAEGGCQAECGSAAAMAAAALVEMRGGAIEECLNAASIALVNVMGLVCDPIAGLIEYPCLFRNSSGVMNAILSADTAMAGIKSIVPFEEVAQTMGEVGKSLEPNLRETGLGGVAGTKTGNRIREEFLKSEE
ncbi:MAG: L-serine ammonia-lyase, iron-sulfur-dependent, subunit alpha [Clostridiales bacterium]|nr:L-serine ammonia-lyase, iron-sulfur-dependent, subunit alpha [Clostridiales bacterium]